MYIPVFSLIRVAILHWNDILGQPFCHNPAPGFGAAL